MAVRRGLDLHQVCARHMRPEDRYSWVSPLPVTNFISVFNILWMMWVVDAPVPHIWAP